MKRENEKEVVQNNTEITLEQPKEVFVFLPYAGTKGEQIGREINATMKSMFKEKITEALFIRLQKPTLNVQGMSTPLLLFN